MACGFHERQDLEPAHPRQYPPTFAAAGDTVSAVINTAVASAPERRGLVCTPLRGEAIELAR